MQVTIVQKEVTNLSCVMLAGIARIMGIARHSRSAVLDIIAYPEGTELFCMICYCYCPDSILMELKFKFHYYFCITKLR